MITLSIFKYDFQKVAKWIAIIFGVFLIIFVVIKIFNFVQNSQKNNQPTVKFGILTKIDFPKGIDNNFNYSINTITGALPSIPSQTKVYKMLKGEPDLLAVQKISDKVNGLGFKNKPLQISDVLFRWDSPSKSQVSLSRSLTFNVISQEFSLTSNFTDDKNILAAKNLPNDEEAISSAQNFLSSLELLPENIDENATIVKLLRIQGGSVIEATSFSNAQLLSVYFFQKINNIPVVYPTGGLSTLNLTLGSGEQNPVIVDGRYSYQKVSDNSSTYPIISMQAAYEKLKTGKAYISAYNGKSTNISIRNAYLAYYYEGKEQDFLEPVIVFEGNDNFFAYVPAVKDEWVSN